MTTPQFGQRASYGAKDVCYRHPDRQSFTLCNRCGKTLCADCQLSHPVGVICVECQRELRPPRSRVLQRAGRSRLRALQIAETPVTNSIIVLCVALWLLQLLVPQTTVALWFAPLYATPVQPEPWRMLTAMFVHSPGVLFHILFNMYALFIFGRELERMLGRGYYLALYVLSGLGGSLAVMWWAAVQPATLVVPTVGASGALFGVMAAVFVVYRKLQVNATALAVLLVINTVMGLLPGTNISWQAHLGGMLFGAVTMLLLFALVQRRRRRAAWVAVAGVAGVIVLLSFVFYQLSPQILGAF